MPASPYFVVHAFLRHEYARAANFYSTGHELYSYGIRLAYYDLTGRVALTKAMAQTYSRTTSRHQNTLRDVLTDRLPSKE